MPGDGGDPHNGRDDQDGQDGQDTDLLAVHQSIAELYAAQGRWQRAYEHLRSALDLARCHRPVPPDPPDHCLLEVERLRREHARAREESLTDVLTATYNRRYLDHRLAELRAEPGGAALAMVDLDLFKDVNDSFGHRIGDQVLRQVVALVQQGLPAGACCARYGGEEFVLVLPGARTGAAVALAERARARIAEHGWGQLSAGLAVTVSIGVAQPRECGPARVTDPHEQLVEADTLLYAAKRAGRNLVAYRECGEIHIVRTVRSGNLTQFHGRDQFVSLDRG
ncbi:diguanylate cyclase (GGDEF)-like protein [Amycolatopsis cihanbeyliensis]|uniref:Diguanylate cyclase (GGDEF)-like protein n=1 Tax=Amycolatopsis cihanbeyliensis TaxID=1128664 RepID=A0A542DKQ9_AMYCI|nr:diguanylate cyclase (GGDEF)-like protein [Amycolatopsis cihanbeyliensis]